MVQPSLMICDLQWSMILIDSQWLLLINYLPPKKNILNWFHLIVNVFHISVCPASHPWPYGSGTLCCSDKVKYGDESCEGDVIDCPSHTNLATLCRPGNYLVLATFVSVFICYWCTVLSYELHTQLESRLFTQTLPNKEAGDSYKKWPDAIFVLSP